MFYLNASPEKYAHKIKQLGKWSRSGGILRQSIPCDDENVVKDEYKKAQIQLKVSHCYIFWYEQSIHLVWPRFSRKNASSRNGSKAHEGANREARWRKGDCCSAAEERSDREDEGTRWEELSLTAWSLMTNAIASVIIFHYYYLREEQVTALTYPLDWRSWPWSVPQAMWSHSSLSMDEICHLLLT